MMQPWFPNAKLGIFIHWGIYAVEGTVESWAFFNGSMPYDDYMNQRHGFTARQYAPEAWADLIEKSGAKYAVLTTKHHDGVALWPTHQSNLNVIESTPAGRDPIGPYCEALRAKNLKVGLYFSHLDWSHPDYASLAAEPSETNPNPFAYAPTDDLEKWQRFLAFHRAQLSELCHDFGAIDLLWFDGDWERSAEQWDMAGLRRQLQEWQPNVILNSRMRGHGDYATPEQALPIVPPEGPWEFCVTMNDNWGYRPSDTNYKSTRFIIRMFCETIGLGGNLLLDIGPREDGTIPDEMASRLLALGAWIKGKEEAIYGTRRGLPAGHFFGPSTLSADGKALYLFVYGDPGSVSVHGLKSKIIRASLLGGPDLTHERVGGPDWQPIPGVVWISLAGAPLDPEVSVIKLELETECQMHA